MQHFQGSGGEAQLRIDCCGIFEHRFVRFPWGQEEGNRCQGIQDLEKPIDGLSYHIYRITQAFCFVDRIFDPIGEGPIGHFLKRIGLSKPVSIHNEVTNYIV